MKKKILLLGLLYSMFLLQGCFWGAHGHRHDDGERHYGGGDYYGREDHDHR